MAMILAGAIAVTATVAWYRIAMLSSINPAELMNDATVALRDRGMSGLKAWLETVTNAFTEEPPQEKFTGHITLARCRDLNRREASTLTSLVQAMTNRSFGDWIAGGVDIIRSQPTPQGSRYTTLATIDLN